jgi:hypothetical protein
MQGIYAIKNKITNKQYIGSTISFKTRWSGHIKMLKKGNHHSNHLKHSWEKYGENAFEFLILEKVKKQKDLIKREQWWIDNSDSTYNMTKIAGSTRGIKKSQKELSRRIITQGGENHWTKTKKFSEESKRKMSNTHKKLYSKGYKNPNKKKIHQCDLNGHIIKKWNSLSEAAKHLNLCRPGISHCISGISKTAGGFKWKLA